MNKKKRKIIRIDEEKCNGCGLCLPGCPEGALQVVEGKVRLVKESYCDGLGACLGHCPQDALQIEERDSDEYDAYGVLAHLEARSPDLAERHREHLRAHGMGGQERDENTPAAVCPSVQEYCRGVEGEGGKTEQAGESGSFSSLGHWPVKLHLLPPAAKFLKNADLVLVADCVPFAYGNMHNDFIKGRAVAAGCPKFDDAPAYEEKIEHILESSNIKSITVVYMEVPCCNGFVRIVRDALESGGKDIPLEAVMIGIKGNVLKKEVIDIG